MQSNSEDPNFSKTFGQGGELLLATANSGKAREFDLILSPILSEYGFKLITLADLPAQGRSFESPVEDGLTFLENAAIKAGYYHQKSGLLTLADDSGLCLEALNGAPGVLSARYGGPGLSDRMRSLKILADLEQILESHKFITRRAYFECSLVLVGGSAPDSFSWSGRLEGTITSELIGTEGFGYDPIFVPSGFSKTLAQMTPEEKNSLSHRALAIKAMSRDLNGGLLADLVGGLTGGQTGA
ncbi:MAG: non-canonical purine NTP pyrophosphatase [Deltaproteobacteria bacterium]|nr:non-canonical purine NTP pyrophosphatase [Deltaproteobacteria bacterium]